MVEVEKGLNFTAFDSMEDMLDCYRQSLEAKNRSHKTINWYLDILKRYYTFLESSHLIKPIDELGKQELQSYIQHLKESPRWPNKPTTKKDACKLSPYSIKGHVVAIKAFWGWLAEEGYVMHNPLVKFPVPKVPQCLIKTLTIEQIEKLVGAIDKSTASGIKYYCVIMILLDTGIRISELVSTKMADLDLSHGLITVLGKGQKQRVVVFSKWTRKVILNYINTSRPQLCSVESVYLFPAIDGSHISSNSVQQYLKRLAQRAGLEGIRCSPHVFRHTFATQSIANEANVFALKDIMGHSSLQTTMKYVHLQVSDLKAQHSKFSPVAGLFQSK